MLRCKYKVERVPFRKEKKYVQYSELWESVQFSTVNDYKEHDK